MEIEMVAREAGEDVSREMQIISPPQHQRVRETSMMQAPDPWLTISRSIRCNWGASGVVRGFDFTVADAVADGADPAAQRVPAASNIDCRR